MANELHTMPLKIERLMSSHRVRLLELDEFGAYMKLLCDAWLNGGRLMPECLSNAQALVKLCGCNAEQAERIKKNVVERFFVVDENGYLVNQNLLEIYNEALQKVKIRTERAKKGAQKRWGNPSNAQAMPKQCLSNANQSQSQSINTKKNIKKKFEKPTVEEIAEYCRERNNGIDPQYFFDSNEAKGWVVGKNQTPMKDWRSAIRTWEKNNASGGKSFDRIMRDRQNKRYGLND